MLTPVQLSQYCYYMFVPAAKISGRSAVPYTEPWLWDHLPLFCCTPLLSLPGAAPFYMSQRAVDKLKSRKTKPATYNLDLNLIADYWGWFKPQRSYHHTGVVSTFYAMREALAIVGDEGLSAMWDRHLAAHEQLWQGLTELGLEPYVTNLTDRLVTVNTIKVPEGVDWAAVSADAMSEYSVEIAGGLGPSAGKVWRIGIMGAMNARPNAVQQVIQAFRYALAKQGWKGAAKAANGKTEL
eukprot:GHUV01009937.1.p1 GENE.GHUV01009937.1~~GHUV01009937.1.p1  ORF type:complete len:239 (+),score=43.89 GHUV01009937.1:264-980(+)